MRFLSTLLVLCGIATGKELDFPDLPPGHWKNFNIEQLSSTEPKQAADLMRAFIGQRPPERLQAEAGLYLARNDGFRKWLPRYFESTPVLWENSSERSEILYAVRHTRAEWAVRFLVELSRDDREKRSLKYDYDDPEFVAELRELAKRDVEAAIAFQKTTGYEMGGTNYGLANRSLSAMRLAGAPDYSERQEKGITVAEWLQQPSQRDRIPEILKATWGDKVVLNAELGLGRDNEPLPGSGGDGSSSAVTERPPPGERDDPSAAAGPPEAGDHDSRSSLPWLVTTGVVMLLAGGLFWYLKRRPATG